ncbi:MAG: response regulator [Deltaproteobacteria bacterium]|nr:response regulator [Deltaproteobacteria bacterium]MBN2671575.1 response regulator [Deltaproteobacteria bacterium]
MTGNNENTAERYSVGPPAVSELKLELSNRDIPLLELNRTPVIIIEQGEIQYVNMALANLYNTTRSAFLHAEIDKTFQSRGLEQMQCWLDLPNITLGENLMLDIQLAPEGHPFRWFNANFVFTTWNDTPAIVGFLSDIEDKKQNKAVEQQLRQSQKMEALGRLAGGVAHDMNNTLGAIMGFTSVMLAEIDPDSRSVQDLEQIMKACRKGKNLMLNLLGFARRGKYRRENFSITKVISDVVDLLSHSISKKIAITKKLESTDIEIFGDPTQLHHALMNICINAVDSMGESGHMAIVMSKITLNSDITEKMNDYDELNELEDGNYIKITVRDTGRGMEPEVVNMAFEPFFTTKPLGEGSGLGLPMVYGTVKNHGGAVILESKPDEGTSVTLLLPISNHASSEMPIAVERKTPSNSPTPTVLLVDDEEMIRHAGKRILEKMGYRVLLAEDGMEGIRVFSEHKEKLAAVILDIMMPVMDGEETFLRLKEISNDVPVLLSSGYSKEEKAEQLIAKGADAFIQKPFDMKTLKDSLTSLIESQNAVRNG